LGIVPRACGTNPMAAIDEAGGVEADSEQITPDGLKRS
jgi:hypothetical protein